MCCPQDVVTFVDEREREVLHHETKQKQKNKISYEVCVSLIFVRIHHVYVFVNGVM